MIDRVSRETDEIVLGTSDRENNSREQGQAHLPAQQPPPCEDARVPPAHAHQGGPRHPDRAPSQGPSTTVGLITNDAVLPAGARLTRSGDFGLVVRSGRRAGRPRLVVHALAEQTPRPAPVGSAASPPAIRVGFVVSKAVGNSVVRHRVTRRLRHVVRARLGTLRQGSTLVVRALPPAAAASSAELAKDFDAAIRRLRLVSVDNGGVV